MMQCTRYDVSIFKMNDTTAITNVGHIKNPHKFILHTTLKKHETGMAINLMGTIDNNNTPILLNTLSNISSLKNNCRHITISTASEDILLTSVNTVFNLEKINFTYRALVYDHEKTFQCMEIIAQELCVRSDIILKPNMGINIKVGLKMLLPDK